MDEESKELVKIGMEAMLAPATDLVATVFGLAGGDYLREFRKRQQHRFAERTAEVLREQKVKNAVPPPPSILLPLLNAAQDESRADLLEIWARLMAAASDPARLSQFRRDYIEIAKQLEPIDAAILHSLKGMDGQHYQGGRVEVLQRNLKVHADQIAVSLGKLNQLGLANDRSPNPALQALGRQFMTILEP
jgi:hypothetical protein